MGKPIRKKSKNEPTDGGKSSKSGGMNALTWPLVIALVIVVAYLWQLKSEPPLEDLANAESSDLKDAMFGEVPYMFYCDRRKTGKKKEVIPASFLEAKNQQTSQIGFALLNCSQVLPSGSTIWEKFKLRRDWRPAVFATAPWMKLTQIPPSKLETTKALQEFIDTDMRARAQLIVSDNDFKQHCAFSKQSSSPTCFVLVKGAKYSPTQADIEEKLILKYPGVRFGKITGSASMFNFETHDSTMKGKNSEKLTVPKSSEYALRMYAIRSGTHYLPMTYSPTLDYINTFVTHALNAPTEDFHSFGDSTKSNSTIHLTKKGSGFKSRKSKSSSTSSESSTQFSSKEEEENAARIEEVRKRREQRRIESAEREKRRIEEMEREMESNFMDSVEAESGDQEAERRTGEGVLEGEEEHYGAEEEEEEEDDEDTIEL